MKSYIILIAAIAAIATAQSTDPRLNSLPNILSRLPSPLVLTNCIKNGNSCSTSGGEPCCLSPIFACQNNPQSGGSSQCQVIAAHRQHISQIQQVLRNFGIPTQNPII